MALTHGWWECKIAQLWRGKKPYRNVFFKPAIPHLELSPKVIPTTKQKKYAQSYSLHVCSR